MVGLSHSCLESIATIWGTEPPGLEPYTYMESKALLALCWMSPHIQGRNGGSWGSGSEDWAQVGKLRPRIKQQPPLF